MSHSFLPKDKVLHPRKPEWGIGEVLDGTKPDKVVVLFEKGGMKSIASKYVQLEKYDPSTAFSQSLTEGQTMRMKKIKPKAPALFKEEFGYVFAPAIYKMFCDGLLVTEWKDKYPFLFDNNDEEFALGPAGEKGLCFLPWIGSILFFDHFKFPTCISYTIKFHSEKQKLLPKILNPEQIALLHSISKEYGAKNLPNLLMYNRDFSKVSFALVRYDNQKITREQQLVWKRIKETIPSDLYLLTLKKSAKQVHILT